MNIGVIGTGNMGGMLAKAFAAHRDLTVRIFNRTTAKAKKLQQDATTIKISSSVQELTSHSDIVFVCTKYADGLKLFQRIGPQMDPHQMLVTTISSLPSDTMESFTKAKVAKVIPSITQTAHSGVILVNYGGRFDDESQEEFEELLRKIATPYVVYPEQIRIASDLASCGPAFLSLLLGKWAKAASGTGRVSHGEAEYLLTKMVIGLAELLQQGMTLSEVVEKVSVPGGVTETGVKSLHRNTQDLFVHLHEATQGHRPSSGAVKIGSA
ncbi:pyrroline-5-carboxylate reductase dimerization domain-containing protein [Alicyclobacillus sp. SO9]|uniref:pyrroline-5-carboxylate reductase dimerization domain-containing protein n=1 Tax=Alicyclobacillus sp. SO9 TaxID=2665646 RepID=UPI0018E7C18D|nr:pyrroline-5-carboxylate reductase dimerization domain-containing protein [Alicyclobacillus sp. SO9]QQE79980.1 NAD(P)-binding domain-containing protein [Alicyclobacillus sp. SO9]